MKSGYILRKREVTHERQATDKPTIAKKRRTMEVSAPTAEELLKQRAAISQANAESLLLSLPPEIRNRIWKLVFGGQCIVLNHPDKYDGHVDNLGCCAVGGTAYDLMEDVRRLKTDAERGVGSQELRACQRRGIGYGLGRAIDDLSLEFMLTCGQIWEETALLPFSANTFVFHNHCELRKFMRVLHVKQAKAITSIVMTESWKASYGFGSRQPLHKHVTLRGVVQSQLTGLKKLVWIMRDNREYDSATQGEASVLACFEDLPLDHVLLVTSFRAQISPLDITWRPPPPVQSTAWQGHLAWQTNMKRRLLGQTSNADEGVNEQA